MARNTVYANYAGWDSDAISIPVTALDGLSDDELLALPADEILDVYRRTAQGGLVVEGGDQTATLELIKRIPISESGPIDVVCRIDDSVIHGLPNVPNMYCDTSFCMSTIPPRISEPRLPRHTTKRPPGMGSELGGLHGLEGALYHALNAVQLQRKFGGDAQTLAAYYGKLWGLGTAFFDRPTVLVDDGLSEADSIAVVDQQSYITYLDVAWQGIIVSTRPSVVGSSFGTNTLIHWERVFFVARLQYLKGIMELAVDIAGKSFEPIAFRIDASIVHHYANSCHGLVLPPAIAIEASLDQRLLDHIANTVAPSLQNLLTQLFNPRHGATLQGKTGQLMLMAPTLHAPIKSMASEYEVRSSRAKVRESWGAESFVPVPGPASARLLLNVFDHDIIPSAPFITFLALCAYTAKAMESVPGLTALVRIDRSIAHNVAYRCAEYIGNNVADSQVLGYLTAVAADTTRNRQDGLEIAYKNTFGAYWTLPANYGKLPRLLQYLIYAIQEDCVGHNMYTGVAKKAKMKYSNVRKLMHRGVLITTPKELGRVSEKLGPARIHQDMLKDMQSIYGKMLEALNVVISAYYVQRLKCDADLQWVLAVARAKRQYLMALTLVQLGDVYTVTISTNDEYRVTKVFANEVMPRDKRIPALLQPLWVAVTQHTRARAWAKSGSIVTIRHPTALKKWLADQIALHNADHAELGVACAAAILDNIPRERTLVHTIRATDVLPQNMQLDIGAPTLTEVGLMYSDLYNAATSDEDLEFLDTLEYDNVPIPTWVRVMQVLLEEGASAAVIQLKGNAVDAEFR
jgi:hypothetical protein